MDETPTCLIEKNSLLREGLKSLLHKSGFQTVLEYSNVDDLEKNNNKTPNYKLSIFSSDNPSDNAEHAIKILKKINPRARIVVLSETFNMEGMAASFSAGADGFLLKDISGEALIASLNLIMAGEKVCPTSMASLIASNQNHWLPDASREMDIDAQFSDRATEIIRCLAGGCSNKIIARNLGITESTVKVHMKSILRKLELANRTQVAIWALNNGIKPITTVSSPLPHTNTNHKDTAHYSSG